MALDRVCARLTRVSALPDKPRSTQPLASDIASMAFLQSSSLCRDLGPEMMNEVIGQATVVDYEAAQVVLEEGEHDNALFFIVEGSVAICKRNGSNFVPLATLERPAVFGETAVLTQQARTATVVTQTDVRLVRVPGELMRSLAERAPTVGRMLATLMAARVKDTEKKLAT